MNGFDRIIEQDPELLIPIIAIGGGVGIALVSIVLSMVTSTLRYRSREQTRREIAAYIAEGSMTPDEGERLLEAGRSGSKCCG